MSEAPQTLDLLGLDDAGFERLYAERIRPCFETHEAERLAAVGAFKQRAAIGGAGILAALMLAWMFGAREFGVYIFILIGLGILVFAWANAKLMEVRKKVKQASLDAIGDAIGVGYTMAPMTRPAFDRLRAMDLLPGHDRSKFEDLFTGAFHGAAFDLYEAHLERRHRDSKGRTSWTTVFRGQIIRLGFPRKFLGTTIVRRDAGVFNMFGGGGRLERVRLEDPKFEKAFEVFGTDQVEARYLLHPMLMERLMQLEAALKGKRLRCAFEQGELLIAIEGGDLFEPGDMWQPLADPICARRIVDDIAGVLRVMDAVLTAQARRP